MGLINISYRLQCSRAKLTSLEEMHRIAPVASVPSRNAHEVNKHRWANEALAQRGAGCLPAIPTFLNDGSWLDLNHAPIDEEFSAVHVTCVVGREE